MTAPADQGFAEVGSVTTTAPTSEQPGILVVQADRRRQHQVLLTSPGAEEAPSPAPSALGASEDDEGG